MLTEWDEYKNIDWGTVSLNVKSPFWVFDTRSILDTKNLKDLGLNIWQLGLGTIIPEKVYLYFSALFIIQIIPDKSIHAVVLILPSKYVISKICINKNIINDIIHALSNFLNNASDFLFIFLLN